MFRKQNSNVNDSINAKAANNAEAKNQAAPKRTVIGGMSFANTLDMLPDLEPRRSQGLIKGGEDCPPWRCGFNHNETTTEDDADEIELANLTLSDA